MCEFHESTCKGFGDIWWTDNPIYFSSIDVIALALLKLLFHLVIMYCIVSYLHNNNYIKLFIVK